jgi:hypothetical protein
MWVCFYKKFINIRRFAGFLGLLICLSAPVPAMAAYNIVLNETARMSWGTLGIPASGSQTVILHPTNATPGGTGSILYGMPNRGQYTLVLSGSGPETSMTLDISGINSGSGNLVLSNFTGIFGSTSIPGFPSGTLSLPATGAGTPLYLGATATVMSGQGTGTINPTFDIDLFLN